jgi:crotonobetainyl-CoA:carnitine CoA-transferase CaiB-like acyl-CoA transferase
MRSTTVCRGVTCGTQKWVALRLAGQPVTLSRTPSKMVTRPPEFGEQTDEVLAEFGFSVDEIGTLKQDKVV